MKCRVWKCYLTGALFVCLCMIVLCKKYRRGETYGDLGDEIVVDFPTHTNRKNQIPKGAYRRISNHKIEPRTITKNTVGHYLNPLYYREFTSSTPYRRQLGVPVRPNTRQFINAIPPWTRNHLVPPWSKKNIIHRPLAVNAPSISNSFMRPPMSRGRAVAAPRPRAPSVARKKFYQPRVAVARTKYRAPVSLKPRYMPRPPGVSAAVAKAKHHVHMQVLPPRAPINRANARQLGIHSGFVLQKASAKKFAQRPMPPRPVLRKPKAGPRTISAPPSRVSDRFSEKKHIWIPLDTRHFNTGVQVPVNAVASYHIDEIGNLIPDISDPKFYEPPSNQMIIAKNTCRIPMKRDGTCPLPSLRTVNNTPKWAKPNYPAPKVNVARNQRLPPPLSQQMARQIKLPPRAGVRRPLAARVKPKSSQRILYFAKPVNKAPPQDMRYQQPRRLPNLPPVRTKPPIARAARPPSLRLQSPRAPSQYEVPEISNNVYRYINERTAPSAASVNVPKTTNPLLKYLQYHRSHPMQAAPNRIDKRSIVTITQQ